MRTCAPQFKKASPGLTFLELLVVLLILSIISVMATGVYQQQVRRARLAAARFEIREIEEAVERYEADVGEFPPSSSGTIGTQDLLSITPYNGNGFLFRALQQSMSGDPINPSSPEWRGPYLKIGDRKVGAGDLGVSAIFSEAMFLDPWGNPYHYVRAGELVEENGDELIPEDYDEFSGTEIPSNNELSNTQEFFNPRTFQIFSFGPNETTFNWPSRGLDIDDVTNFVGRSLTPGLGGLP